MRLAELAVGTEASITAVSGTGSFRRRLLELGLLPGTRVEVLGVAPLGDPLELLVRGSSLSIRRNEAALVEVTPTHTASATQSAPLFGEEARLRGEP